MGDILYYGSEIAVKSVLAGDPAGPLVITFQPENAKAAQSGRNELDKPGYKEAFFKSLGINAVHFLSSQNHWYQSSEMADALAAIRDVVARASRAITYGSSMGGYAAVRFGPAADASAALAISPQFSINPSKAPFETRSRKFFDAKRWSSEELAGDSFAAFDTFLFYDFADPDSEHAALFGRELPNVTLINVPFGGHPAEPVLKETGLLQEVLVELLEGRQPERSFHSALRTKRAGSPTYLRNLYEHSRKRPSPALAYRAGRAVFKAGALRDKRKPDFITKCRAIGDADLAREVVLTVDPQKIGDARTLHALVSQCSRLAFHDQAIEFAKHCVQRWPDDAKCLDALGRAQQFAGQRRKALASFAAAKHLSGVAEAQSAVPEAPRVDRAAEGQSLIVLTTCTSGTASLKRIVRAIAGGGRQIVEVGEKPGGDPAGAGLQLDPGGDAIYWFQGAEHWNADIDLSRFRILAHFRDPRDLNCNRYYGDMKRPSYLPLQEEMVSHLDEKQQNLENFVLGQEADPAFAAMRALGEGPAGERIYYTSYTQLCVAFDQLVYTLCTVLDADPFEIRETLIRERPENLFGNPDWLAAGGSWRGSDTAPGRFRQEISSDGQKILADKLGVELDFCRSHDVPWLRYLYD